MTTATVSQRADDVAESETFTFTLALSGQDEITDELEKALLDAGCDDALLSLEDGQMFLTFDRDASGIERAIATAIRDAESTSLVTVIAVLPPGYSAIEKFNWLLGLRKNTSLPNLSQALNAALSEIIDSST